MATTTTTTTTCARPVITPRPVSPRRLVPSGLLLGSSSPRRTDRRTYGRTDWQTTAFSRVIELPSAAERAYPVSPPDGRRTFLLLLLTSPALLVSQYVDLTVRTPRASSAPSVVLFSRGPQETDPAVSRFFICGSAMNVRFPACGSKSVTQLLGRTLGYFFSNIFTRSAVNPND